MIASVWLYTIFVFFPFPFLILSLIIYKKIIIYDTYQIFIQDKDMIYPMRDKTNIYKIIKNRI